MKNKYSIACIIITALCLINLNHSYVYAEKIKLKNLFKKKTESKNDIQGSTSANDSSQTPTLNKCKKKIATLAVVEPQDYEMLALSQYSLPSPTSLIRLIAQQSNCFIVVERGIAMQNLLQERSLSSSGELKQDQDMGKGQMITADYILTPTIIFKEGNTGGVAGALGGLLPGAAGSVAGIVGGSLKFSEAQTSLTLADTRSGIQVAAAAGASKKTSFGVVAGLGGSSAGVGLGAYANTPEGKVVAAAFLQTYNSIVSTVDGDQALVRENSLLEYKKEGGKKVKKAKKSAIGEIRISKINNVPVYSDPEGKNEIFKLTSKEEVVILAEEGAYYNIMASNGEGWVKKILIK
tara:strand:- start:244 stop:1293 length:1050 start_codon:yes stop_codon:yes gene_type:complete